MNNILMRTDRLDDDSVVVNFDLENDKGEVIKQSGYVHIRQEDRLGFSVTIYNASGYVLSEVNIPFEFKGF
jgi:hypothetical protein